MFKPRLALLAASIGLVAPVAQALVLSYGSSLSGASEVPPNPSSASGDVTVIYDTVLHSLSVDLSFSALSTPASAGHIHCCTAPGSNIGVAVGFTGLPATTSGTYSNTFDLTLASTYTSTFLTNFGGGTAAGAEAALAAGLHGGQAYANLHNATYPGGEIRGNLVAVPEPGSYAMMALGLAALGVVLLPRRLRRESR